MGDHRVGLGVIHRGGQLRLKEQDEEPEGLAMQSKDQMLGVRAASVAIEEPQRRREGRCHKQSEVGHTGRPPRAQEREAIVGRQGPEAANAW